MHAVEDHGSTTQKRNSGGRGSRDGLVRLFASCRTRSSRTRATPPRPPPASSPPSRPASPLCAPAPLLFLDIFYMQAYQHKRSIIGHESTHVSHDLGCLRSSSRCCHLTQHSLPTPQTFTHKNGILGRAALSPVLASTSLTGDLIVCNRRLSSSTGASPCLGSCPSSLPPSSQALP